MFEKFSNIIEGKFAGPLEKLSNQRHLRAIRDGIIATLPIIIVSSLLMVVAFSYNQMPESWALAKFIKANAVAILLPYRMSMYIMTLYAVFGIGYSLAKSYDLDGLSGAIMAELTFLLTIVPVSIPDVTDSITALASKNAELNAFLQQLPSGYVIPAENLGSAGMFIGILSAFIGVEIYRFTQVKGIKITMPAAVPPAVARSFESLTPTIIIILGMSTITMWLGIDGGGTKTKMVSYDDDGNIGQEIVLPTVHILSQTPKKCIEILKAGVEQLDPQSVSKIGIGLAGYGQDKKIRKEIEDICLKAFKNRPFVLKSDVQIAIEGALDGQDGIVVIAGTGSIALSLKEGMLQRCGGWGYQLGDEGSAYWIAKKMLNVFCQEVDGRLEKTILYDLIKRECHLVNDYDIITFMNNLNHDRTKIAALAYINGLAAKEKDPNALKIYKQAAEEIYKLINLLSKNFKSPISVSYIGGVFQHAGSFIIPHLQDQLGNRFNLIPPIHTPEYGAYILAKKLR